MILKPRSRSKFRNSGKLRFGLGSAEFVYKTVTGPGPKSLQTTSIFRPKTGTSKVGLASRYEAITKMGLQSGGGCHLMSAKSAIHWRSEHLRRPRPSAILASRSPKFRIETDRSIPI